MLEWGHVDGPEVLVISVAGLEGSVEFVVSEGVIGFGLEDVAEMVFVLAVGGCEIDVPLAL